MADSRIEELRRRLDRDPASRLFAQLAEEYRKAGSHADAIRVARTGLAQHPSYPSARLTLGRALLESGDPAGARAELEEALREAPDNILASRFLGQALEALGELAPAIAQLERTLAMAPGDRQLERQIVSLQARLGSPQPPAAPRAPARAPLPETPRASAEPAARTAIAEVPAPAAAAPPPPTIKIRPPGDSGAWTRKAAVPPPLPPSAAPTAATPAGPPPLPAPSSTPTERLPPSASNPFDSEAAPTLPPGHGREFAVVDETAVPTLPPGVLSADEMVFEPEPPAVAAPAPAGGRPARPGPVEEPRPAEPPRRALEEAVPPEPPGAPGSTVGGATATPFSSSTLAELYLKQGLVDRAVEVYRQLLVEEPRNERARARLAEIERMPPGDAAREARRNELSRMIAALEALLAVVRRT